MPTRGDRGAPGTPGFGAAGPGRGPGAGAGAAGLAGAGGDVAAGAAGGGAAGAAAAAGAVGIGAAGTGAVGTGAAGAGAGAAGFGAVGTGAGAEAATAPPSGAGALAGAVLTGAVTGFSADLPPPKASRSRRATGASTVEEADLTNSPCSLRRASTSLLVTPSSFANSCTRALPATPSPSLEATAVGRPRPGFSYDKSSPELHGVLMFFRCLLLLGRGVERRDVLHHRGRVRRAGDAQRSGEGPPPDRCRQTAVVGVQPRTPARSVAGADGESGRTAPRRRRGGHHPEQFDGQPSLPAADAGPHRRGALLPLRGRNLALDHGSV